MKPAPRFLVMGAGSVGCYLGGCLQHAGAQVDFVGRPLVLQTLRTHGLRLSDRDGRNQFLAPAQLRLHEQVPTACHPDLVLLCVKSRATEAAAQELERHLAAGTPVLSLQNGLHNVTLAQAVAPGLNWLAGMVPFNIAEIGPGCFHRGSDGQLAAEEHAPLARSADWFAQAGVPLALHADLKPIQRGKLLLNLNNPVNALSGLPLRAQLLDAGYRQQFAGLMREALALMRLDGAEPAALTPLPWNLLIRILCLPTPLFRLIAARLLRIDPQARSSMADDLAAGRPTEIDVLCGEIVRLAERLGRRAPLNEAMVARIQTLSTRPTTTP
ncbi:2-dehydropantoate 2-reductase [Azonexus hydrophilus]|uniref:2-dehydropantoate 2-reductase n=1 Tax=Azonexus hydrophilus TaxID=418702 RepID=A0ABZ2XJD1_9RHOO